MDKKKISELYKGMLEVAYERYVEILTKDGYNGYISTKEEFNENTERLRKEYGHLIQ